MNKLGVPYSNCEHISEIPCTTEEESLAIATGIILGGGECQVFMQNSGYGRCLDIITSLIIPYEFDIEIEVSNREDLHHKIMGKLYPKLCEELKQLK